MRSTVPCGHPNWCTVRRQSWCSSGVVVCPFAQCMSSAELPGTCTICLKFNSSLVYALICLQGMHPHAKRRTGEGVEEGCST